MKRKTKQQKGHLQTKVSTKATRLTSAVEAERMHQPMWPASNSIPHKWQTPTNKTHYYYLGYPAQKAWCFECSTIRTSIKFSTQAFVVWICADISFGVLHSERKIPRVRVVATRASFILQVHLSLYSLWNVPLQSMFEKEHNSIINLNRNHLKSPQASLPHIKDHPSHPPERSTNPQT